MSPSRGISPTTPSVSIGDPLTPELQETKNAWDSIAPGYDAFVTPTNAGLAEQVLERAGVAAGDRVLDVAAGSGAVSLPAARRGAQVLAIDISPQMIAKLSARAQGDGLDVEARVMDGHHLQIDDEAVDVAVSQFGLMLFPDLRQGLREMVRVTRSGGRVAVVAFGPPQEVEFLTFFLSAMKQVDPGFTGLPMDPPPLPFQVADPARLQRELQDAGLHEVRVDRVVEALHFASGPGMWDWVVNSNPIARMLIRDLDREQQDAVKRVLDGMLRERADGDGHAAVTSRVHIAIGTK